MFSTGLGTAAPAQCYSQKQCWDTLLKSERFQALEPRSRAILRKVLTSDNGITTRHPALDDLNEAFAITADALHARFVKYAPMLVTQAAERALEDAEARPADIGAMII